MNFKIFCLSQKGPINQMQALLDAKMYNAALHFAEQLIDSDCPLITINQYIAIQRQSGLHYFMKKFNYDAALACFTEWRLPLPQLILLFAEVYPKKFIDDLLKMSNLKKNKNDQKIQDEQSKLGQLKID